MLLSLTVWVSPVPPVMVGAFMPRARMISSLYTQDSHVLANPAEQGNAMLSNQTG